MAQKHKSRLNLPFIIVAVVALISLVVNVFLLKERKNDNQVTEVVDGDTFQIDIR